jgi:hypothetical protein
MGKGGKKGRDIDFGGELGRGLNRAYFIIGGFIKKIYDV